VVKDLLVHLVLNHKIKIQNQQKIVDLCPNPTSCLGEIMHDAVSITRDQGTLMSDCDLSWEFKPPRPPLPFWQDGCNALATEFLDPNVGRNRDINRKILQRLFKGENQS
jgi:hypothetical protein